MIFGMYQIRRASGHWRCERISWFLIVVCIALYPPPGSLGGVSGRPNGWHGPLGRHFATFFGDQILT